MIVVFAFKTTTTTTTMTMPFARTLMVRRPHRSNLFHQNIEKHSPFLQSPKYKRFSDRLIPFVSLRQLQSTKFDAIEATGEVQTKKPVPVILLAGFLGTGKTSTLKHLLENNVNLKVGVIVNDVASVNIDAKLVTGSATTANLNDMTTSDTTTFVDLQNGCVCCSLADELFFSIENLIMQRKFLDLIVIELSGVADPIVLKNNWIMAPKLIQDIATLSKIITIIDASTFGIDYMTWDIAMDRPSWFPTSANRDTSGNDDDIYYNMDGGTNDSSGSMRKVAELLAEQVEAADMVLMNKIDLADDDQIKVATTVVTALNDKANIEFVQYGRIEPMILLEDTAGKYIGEQKQHDEHHHEHSHSHHHNENYSETLTATTSASSEDCSVPGCTEPSHSHDHAAATISDCSVPGCTDPTHSHDHHGHSHTHTHHQQEINNDIGLINFVYKATRPFHAGRLMNVLNQWPVPVKDVLDLSMLQNATQSTSYEVMGKKTRNSKSPFVGILRSKGFCWFAPYQWTGRDADMWRHDTAMYWSHAGKQFGISSAGKWWDTIPPELMKKYFMNNVKEYDRIIRDDFVTKEFGDRRQEIVFIGTQNVNEALICNVLDSCLLNDIEMEQYKQQLYNHNLLSSSSLAS